MSRKHKDNTKTFDYTTITDRLRTVSWSDNSRKTSMVILKFKGIIFQHPATVLQSKGLTLKDL